MRAITAADKDFSGDTDLLSMSYMWNSSSNVLSQVISLALIHTLILSALFDGRNDLCSYAFSHAVWAHTVHWWKTLFKGPLGTAMRRQS